MLTQYENNKVYFVDTIMIKRQMCHFTVRNEPQKPLGGHFEFTIFIPNMKTIGPNFCGHRGDQQAKLSFFHQKSASVWWPS